MFAFGKRSASIVARATRKGRAQDVVIPDPDFKLPGALLGIGATFFATERQVNGFRSTELRSHSFR